MSTLPPPLTASRSLLPPILHLSLSVLVLLLSTLLVVLESRLSPRQPRLLADGEAKHITRPIPAPTPPPPRARVLLTLLRLLLALALLASLVHTLVLTVRYIAAPPPASLASAPVNRWAHSLLNRTLLQYALDHSSDKATRLANRTIRVGVGDRAEAPGEEPVGKLRWATLLLLVVAVASVGTAVALLPHAIPAKRPVAWLIFAQALLLFVVALPAALIRPTSLPVDAAPLVNHWMDRVYHDEPEYVNETRFIGNWFVALPDKRNPAKERIRPLSKYRDITAAFCTQLTELLPTTGSEVAGDDATGTLAPPTTTPVQTDAVVTTVTTTATTVAPATTDSSQSEEEPPADNSPVTTAPATTGVRPTPPTGTTAVVRQEQEDEDDPAAPEIPRPDMIPVEPLPPELQGELFLVYLVGKPIGHDQYRILSYMALGAMVGAPVAVGQMCSAWILYPFVALWAAVWVLLVLLATPSVLRVLRVPVEKAQVFKLCGIQYRVLVADKTTMLIARLDASFFAVVLLIALVQGYRWLRLAEKNADEDNSKDEKLVNYEEVYNRSGSLRW